ncbi:hypothetical protein NQZ68_033669 [Dissostichus eleginoides]|nr:hypothetical protein NQZ68_033669 [Dissostichus eleginoides]
MCLQCDVTKKNREDFTVLPREGAYLHGLYMEGARWDSQTQAKRQVDRRAGGLPLTTLLPLLLASNSALSQGQFCATGREQQSERRTGIIAYACLKELTPAMPVIFLRAVPEDKQESRSVYQCPFYKTHQRGPTYVWTFNLKTKESPSKWTLAGVALLLQI